MTTQAAKSARYRASGKHYAAVKRYRQTAKGRAARKKENAKRLWIGGRFVGYSEQAKTINAHIKERMSAFQRLQSGAETESGTTGTIPAKTGA